jgi:hypothetical protein
MRRVLALNDRHETLVLMESELSNLMWGKTQVTNILEGKV